MFRRTAQRAFTNVSRTRGNKVQVVTRRYKSSGNKESNSDQGGRKRFNTGSGDIPIAGVTAACTLISGFLFGGSYFW
jgi:hypothetical protein